MGLFWNTLTLKMGENIFDFWDALTEEERHSWNSKGKIEQAKFDHERKIYEEYLKSLSSINANARIVDLKALLLAKKKEDASNWTEHSSSGYNSASQNFTGYDAQMPDRHPSWLGPAVPVSLSPDGQPSPYPLRQVHPPHQCSDKWVKSAWGACWEAWLDFIC